MTTGPTARQLIERTFANFGYVYVQPVEAVVPFCSDWSVCAFIETSGDTLMLACTPELAQLLFDGHTGTANDAAESAQVDVVKELANVLAGQLYDHFFNGAKPGRISIPTAITAADAAALWDSEVTATKLPLSMDGTLCGALRLEFKDQGV
jgi:hypothetical protein